MSASEAADRFDLEAWLDHVQLHGIKLGLDNTRRALQALGEPQRAYPSVLVGGTNGKGSTVAFATSLLHSAGLRVGSTISPHLTEYRERFRIDGVPVSAGRLAAHASRVHPVLTAIPELDKLTFFELGASLALSLFAAESVDVAVVEVGMGGEFDATRGCEPAVGVVVSVDEDHLAHLGPTIEDVARTKARIAPPGGVLVVGEDRSDRLAILREESEAAGSELWVPGGKYRLSGSWDSFSYRGPALRVSDVKLGLTGEHQAQNAAAACAAVEALHEVRGTPLPTSAQAAHALRETRFPGRFEEVRRPAGPVFLLDGAHNPAGAMRLGAALAKRGKSGRRWWVLATKRDKRLNDLLRAILPHVDGVVATRGLTSDKFVSPEEVAIRVAEAAHGGVSVLTAPGAAEALALVEGRLGDGDEVLVAGSLYLVGDMRPLLGLPIA